MDWSLLQPHSKVFLLRDLRGYKNVWWYYGAMVFDIVIRFNWILYAAYTQDVQHSTLVSFIVAFTEATRRGIWAIFRVENEHCSNVAHFKASRDVPLPYLLEEEQSSQEFGPEAEGTGARSLKVHRPFQDVGLVLVARLKLRNHPPLGRSAVVLVFHEPLAGSLLMHIHKIFRREDRPIMKAKMAIPLHIRIMVFKAVMTKMMTMSLI